MAGISSARREAPPPFPRGLPRRRGSAARSRPLPPQPSPPRSSSLLRSHAAYLPPPTCRHLPHRSSQRHAPRFAGARTRAPLASPLLADAHRPPGSRAAAGRHASLALLATLVARPPRLAQEGERKEEEKSQEERRGVSRRAGGGARAAALRHRPPPISLPPPLRSSPRPRRPPPAHSAAAAIAPALPPTPALPPLARPRLPPGAAALSRQR